MNENTNPSRLLTYENLINYANNPENAGKLVMTAGKAKFKVAYTVENNNYPKRTVEFEFTLNNEVPTIDCSIKPGEKTSNGFTITFNSGIIYEQVGKAYIYINDKVVAEINENSANMKTSITTSFNANGAGDYYVQLVTESGTVLNSFKVTITEPLNVWAIIIIVVVVLAVGSVITVIIVLRHRMKIR